jgi:hypothetical protein
MKYCTVCTKELPGHRQRFCSDRCSREHRIEVSKRRRKRLQLDPIPCANCGESFIPRSIRNKYCSNDCWTVVQIQRRDAKRRLLAKVPKEKDAIKRFHPIWKTPVFGERIVTEAKFTKADTPERKEIQAAVEEYLKNGGKITRYGDQIGKTLLELEGEIKWEVSESEQKDIQDELAHMYKVEECI